MDVVVCFWVMVGAVDALIVDVVVGAAASVVISASEFTDDTPPPQADKVIAESIRTANFLILKCYIREIFLS